MKNSNYSQAPFPITATVYSERNSISIGLISFGSLYKLAEMKAVRCIVFHGIAKESDVAEDVAEVMEIILRHLEVCLMVKGQKSSGYDLKLADGGFDLSVLVASCTEST